MELIGDIHNVTDRQRLCDWLSAPDREWRGMFVDGSLPASYFAVRNGRIYFGSEGMRHIETCLGVAQVPARQYSVSTATISG